MKALHARQHECVFRRALSLGVVYLFLSLVTLLPAEVAMARTKPVVEAGDPDIGNEKPRSGATSQASAAIKGMPIQGRNGTLRSSARVAWLHYLRLMLPRLGTW